MKTVFIVRENSWDQPIIFESEKDAQKYIEVFGLGTEPTECVYIPKEQNNG